MNAITFLNNTAYPAHFSAKKGGQVLARLVAIMPGARAEVPTEGTYSVSATTVVDGNTYATAPVTIEGGMHFLAQVRQMREQGTYVFEIVVQPDGLGRLSFEKTTLNPVVFTLAKDGEPLQTVVVNSSFETVEIGTAESYSFQAIVNGITTEPVTTANPNAVVTAVAEPFGDGELGYFVLVVS
jgi:hypothetical protein